MPEHHVRASRRHALRDGLRVSVPLRCPKIQHSPTISQFFCDVFCDVFAPLCRPTQLNHPRIGLPRLRRKSCLEASCPALSSCIGASCLQLLLLYRQSLMGCSQETRGVARSCFSAKGHTRIWNGLRDSNQGSMSSSFDPLQQIHKKEASRTTATQSHTMPHHLKHMKPPQSRLQQEGEEKTKTNFWIFLDSGCMSSISLPFAC